MPQGATREGQSRVQETECGEGAFIMINDLSALEFPVKSQICLFKPKEQGFISSKGLIK